MGGERMGKGLVLIGSWLLLAGCAGLDMVETRVLDADGAPILEVESKRDALVQYEDGGRKLTVDNRGQASTMRTVIDAWLLRTINKE